jgi:autophagy-related protein 2
VKTAAVESLNLGAKIAVGTHTLLQKADDILSKEAGIASSSSSPYQTPVESPRKKATSMYANQPKDTREGLQLAFQSISRNISEAVQVIAMPVETMERDGATGTMRAVIRAVPIAVLKPMLGATDAVSKTLFGIRNSVDPSKQQELQDVRNLL